VYPESMPTTFRLALITVLLAFSLSAQTPHEELLTPDNAYNPIPSPDGRFIAYVRTGWGDGISSGFGRSHLVSEPRIMSAEGSSSPRILEKNFFISGWTPDNQVVCYRDGRYRVFSIDGNQTASGEILKNINPIDRRTEWVAYAPSLKTLVLGHAGDGDQRTIETLDHTIVAYHGTFSNDRVVPSPDGRYLAVFGQYSDTALQIYDLTRKS
jgi:WD40 repeat protein